MKAFFKELTGKSQITSNDLRKLDTSYDPSVLGESTKVDYLRVIDILIESRGESFILPLSWPLAASMFPSLQNRVLQRRAHREYIHHMRSEQQSNELQQSLNELLENTKQVSLDRLRFCRPREHKLWLRDWHDDIHGQGVSEVDIYLMLKDWWARFWVTSYRNDYIWCTSLYELLNEIDYVLSTLSTLELSICISALPILLPV